MKINSHNEWDKLREVIVGTVDHFSIGLEFHTPKPDESLFHKAVKIAERARPSWYVDEVGEDLAGLCEVLTKFGAKILRPKDYHAENLFRTPDWSSTGKDLYNVRDIHIIFGDTVVVGPSSARCRYFEPNAFYDIWYEYFEAGFKWITAPKPRLLGQYLVPYYRDGEEVLTDEDVIQQKLSGGRAEKHFRLTEDEILFDAANVIRMGRDLLYLISSTGNAKGAQWLQMILGADYRVHTTTTYRSSHLDSTILPLKPGLVLINSARVTPETCPPVFKKWDKIWFGANVDDMAPLPQEELDFQKNVREKAYYELLELGVESDLNHMSSPWAGLNVLSLDENTVLVHDRQTKLIQELERHKFKVIPIRMRHCYTMLGGLHCSTLDLVRDSKLESYCD